MPNNKWFLLGLLGSSACLTAPTDETEGVQQIHGASSPASAFQLARAVKINGCTATRISSQFAITAAHCGPGVGTTVRFYSAGPGFDAGSTGRIEQVFYRPGITSALCSERDTCIDSTGLFADVAVIRVSSDAADDNALSGAQASLGWTYPGEDQTGKKVGAGGHSGNPNPNGILLQVTDTTESASDSDGSFETTTDDVDPGDSGGPFYVGTRTMGTLWGHGWDPLDGYWAHYTSIPKHLDWILEKIGYKWSGQPTQASTYFAGSTLEVFNSSSELRCQYACEKTASCEGYGYFTTLDQCYLFDNITGPVTSANWSGALKHGVSGGNSADVVGFVRGDGINAVMHEATNGHIHELHLATSWLPGDISNGSPPAVAGKLSAYERADGTNAVVYRSTTGRIIEIALVAGQWTWFDLTNTGGATAVGDPMAYVRADGVSAIVFRSANGHINELRLGSRSWIATDLTAAAGSSVVASSDPAAFVRSDGYSSVVFRGGGTVYELYKAPGGTWSIGAPSSFATGAPAAASRPYGYTHADGTNAIVYRSTANQIVELFLSSTGWKHGVLANNANGNPVAYVRTDSIESIVFRSGSQIFELTNNPWQGWNLSAAPGAQPVVSDPSVYIRKDGFHAVLAHGANNHVTELAWKRGQPSWVGSDLTIAANETP